MDRPIPPHLVLLAASLGFGGCYFGAGVGGAIPLRAPAPSGAGAVISLEAGFQYDYKRLLRVLVIGSGQQGGGVHVKTGGQVLEAPYGTGLGLDVTVLRRPDYLWRLTGRAWPFPQEVAVGDTEAQLVQPGSRVRTAFLGGNLHLLGDTDEIGPVGVSLLAGVLVQRVSGTALGGPQWAVAPMLLLGMDWSWKVFHCWFVNDACSHYLLRAKN